MADYNEKLEYILDNGLECECCPLRTECSGDVKQTDKGPVLPACAEHDFNDILDSQEVNRVYRERYGRWV